jgi:hypothetical protein
MWQVKILLCDESRFRERTMTLDFANDVAARTQCVFIRNQLPLMSQTISISNEKRETLLFYKRDFIAASVVEMSNQSEVVS